MIAILLLLLIIGIILIMGFVGAVVVAILFLKKCFDEQEDFGVAD